MTTKTYAVLDPHAVGPDMAIEAGGTIATCLVSGDDNQRLIRFTEGFSSGLHYFECTFYGEGDLPGKVAVGIVTAAHPLNQYVGQDASGVGYLAGDGNVESGATPVATCDATAKEVVIGVLVDGDADTVTFFSGNTVIASVAIPSGQTWYGAVSCGCTIAFDTNAYIVTGAVAFAYPQPNAPAWFTETSGSGTLHLSARTGFLTSLSDTPANIGYMPDILDDTTFSISRKVGVWVWSDQNFSANYASLPADNNDGRYDFVLDADARNGKVTCRLVPYNGTFADSFVVGTPIIDSVKTDGESKLRLSLKDAISAIQRPLQTRIFPPYLNAGAAGRPLPIVLGAVRNVEPTLIKEQEDGRFLYQISDQAITNIGVLRDQGDPLDPNGTPPDYTPTNDFTGLLTQVEPAGKLTGDFSNVGAQYQIPGVDDVLADAGLFTIWTNPSNPPDGWSTSGSGTITREGTSGGWPQNYVARLSTTDPWSPADSKFGKVIDWPSTILKAGRTYNITLKIFAASGTLPDVLGIGYFFGLRVLSALDNAPSSSITPYNQPLRVPAYLGDQQYTLTYTVPGTVDRLLYCSVAASTGSTPDTSTGTAFVDFYGIRVEELSNSVADIPLQGMTLTAFMDNMMARAGLTSSDWVRQDALDIDAATGYESLGAYFTDPITIENAIRSVLDSYCAALSTDHLGRLRIGRLIDPALTADGDVVMSFDTNAIQYGVDVQIDEATGLTTSAGAKENYYIFSQTDFVSDDASTGINAATRFQFTRESQLLLASTSPLADFYVFAKSAPAINYKFDDGVEAQTEIDRVNELFSVVRKFYTLTVLFDSDDAAAIAQLKFGDVVEIDYRPPMPGSPDGKVRYGLDHKKLMVVDTTLSAADFSLQLELWG